VLAQPDVFVPLDPPGPSDTAWQDAAGTSTQADVLTDAARSDVVTPGGRLLTDANPCTRAGLSTLTAAVVLDAATVWVRNPDEASWAARAQQERATDQLRG
jgi:hypothetical protein